MRCYMCERPKTSDEHVPPRCLFPEAKDLGPGYRENLITVPSCDTHNGQKSRDDEFLMVSLAGIIGNNSIGYRHKFTKVDRALRRTSGRLIDKVFRSKTRHVWKLDGNKFIEVIWGTPDAARLQRCLDHVVRGLYFHHFGCQFEGTITTLFSYMHQSEKRAAEFFRYLKDHAEHDLKGLPRFGANPDVFFYRVTEPDKFGLRLFHLCFYGGLDIYSALLPKGSEKPYHLGFELLWSGVRTTVTLGDKKYEFNEDV